MIDMRNKKKRNWAVLAAMMALLLFLPGCGQQAGSSLSKEGRMQQDDQENLYDFRNDLKRCDRIEIYAANSSQPLCMMNTSEQIEAFMEDKLLLSDWKPAAIPQSIVLNYQYKCSLFQREDLYFAQGSGENKGQRGRLKNMADFFIYDQDHYIRISIQGFIMDFKMPSAVDIETYAGELTNG